MNTRAGTMIDSGVSSFTVSYTKVAYMIIFAVLHLGTWLVVEPVFEGKTCKALPSAVVFLVIYAFVNILMLPIELYNNWKRIEKLTSEKSRRPHQRCDPFLGIFA